MLICVEGAKKQLPHREKKTTQRQKERQEKKYVVAVRGGEGEKKQRASQITPSSLPPSSLVETSRESVLTPRPDYD